MRGQPGRDSAGKTVRVQERDLAVVHGWARPERWSESRKEIWRWCMAGLGPKDGQSPGKRFGGGAWLGSARKMVRVQIQRGPVSAGVL